MLYAASLHPCVWTKTHFMCGTENSIKVERKQDLEWDKPEFNYEFALYSLYDPGQMPKRIRIHMREDNINDFTWWLWLCAKLSSTYHWVTIWKYASVTIFLSFIFCCLRISFRRLGIFLNEMTLCTHTYFHRIVKKNIHLQRDTQNHMSPKDTGQSRPMAPKTWPSFTVKETLKFKHSPLILPIIPFLLLNPYSLSHHQIKQFYSECAHYLSHSI